MKKFYSIIIPVRNQEKYITNNLNELINKLEKSSFISKFEVILVDDGSHDKTIQKIRLFKKKLNNITLVKNKLNKGKGYSVKKGINFINKKSDKIILIDADIPYSKSFKPFIRALSSNNLVIINRKDERSKLIIKKKNFYIFYRIFVGLVLNFIFRFLKLTNLKDTQAGLKGFNSSLKNNFNKIKTDGFLFDIEFLLILSNKKIYPKSIPCIYSVSKKSSIGFNLNIYFKIMNDFLIILYNNITNKYV